MDNQGLRNVFEREYQKQFNRRPALYLNDFGRYTDAHMQGSWWGYQVATLNRPGAINMHVTMAAPGIERITRGQDDGR